MPAIEISQLAKSYAGTQAVDGVDLAFEPQERIAVLGKSGAGKSTLLRLIAGLEEPDRGRILMQGIDVTQLSPQRRGVAFVSQDYALYPQLTVQKNLEAALASLRLNRGERNDRCNDVLAWFQLEKLYRHFPSQLSGGQAQRVALAKAMIRRPRLLLLDEPLSQVDIQLREELRELIREAVERYATALVMVTHDPCDAMRLATRIAILDQGKITQFAAPENIYRSPVSTTAAELLSQFGVNWLSPGVIAACTNPMDAHWIDRDVFNCQHVGFRPEDARIEASECLQSPVNSLVISATIQEVQPLGYMALARARAAGQTLRCRAHTQWLPEQLASIVVPCERLIRIGKKP